MNKKSTTKINWDEVDAVPEDEYNYMDAPEITPDMFRQMVIMYPDKNSSKKQHYRLF